MRLHEFTNKKDHTRHTDDTEQVERKRKSDDALQHPKNKPQTKQMKPLDKR